MLQQIALMVEGTMPIGTVVLLGIGTVFVGLICIVILCTIMGKIVPALTKKEAAPAASLPTAPSAPVSAPISNRQQLVAAISCVLAEELGTDVKSIRIVSLKKL